MTWTMQLETSWEAHDGVQVDRQEDGWKLIMSVELRNEIAAVIGTDFAGALRLIFPTIRETAAFMKETTGDDYHFKRRQWYVLGFTGDIDGTWYDDDHAGVFWWSDEYNERGLRQWHVYPHEWYLSPQAKQQVFGSTHPSARAALDQLNHYTSLYPCTLSPAEFSR